MPPISWNQISGGSRASADGSLQELTPLGLVGGSLDVMATMVGGDASFGARPLTVRLLEGSIIPRG